ncbi:MAG: hypothetical protein K6E18_01370 [Lachnospiraceae bacterium]|nr:hypothetical protein [Lachnospiraceae bacterium]
MDRLDPATLRMREKIYKELKVTFLSIENQIKEIEENKREYEMKCDLYGQCLSEKLLSEGSDIVKEHLTEAKAEMEACDRELEKLKMQREAYRIEIEIFDANMR